MIATNVLKSFIVLGLSSFLLLSTEVNAVCFGGPSCPGGANKVSNFDGVVTSITLSNFWIFVNTTGGSMCLAQIRGSTNTDINNRISITSNSIPLLRKSLREGIPIKMECINEVKFVVVDWFIAYE